MKKLKEYFFISTAILAVISVMNLHPIKVNAEILVSTGEYVDFKKLKKGDVFYEGYEDEAPLVYRVVKTASKKNPRIYVEIAGINQNFDWDEYGYTDRNKLDISVDVLTMERISPYTIIGIADNAFKDDQTIHSFDVWGCSDFKYIGKNAFKGCTNLSRFYATPQTTTIKARAFYGCSSLKKIFLTGNKLKRVGKNAFMGTKTKMKLVAENMNDTQVTKVKKLFKKAGAKKLRIKRKFY